MHCPPLLTRICFAVIATGFALLSVCHAEDTNYILLSKGDWVTYRITIKTDATVVRSFTRKETVKEITPQDAVFTHEIREDNGSKVIREVRMPLQGYDSFLQFSSFALPQGKNLELVSQGKETLNVAGKPLACIWEQYEGTMEDQRRPLKLSYKLWLSPQVPIGRVVRLDTGTENIVDGKILRTESLVVLENFALSENRASVTRLLTENPSTSETTVSLPQSKNLENLISSSFRQPGVSEKIAPSLGAVGGSGTLSEIKEAVSESGGGTKETVASIKEQLARKVAEEIAAKARGEEIPSEGLMEKTSVSGLKPLPSPATALNSALLSDNPILPVFSERNIANGTVIVSKDPNIIQTSGAQGYIELTFTQSGLASRSTASASLQIRIPPNIPPINLLKVYHGPTLLGSSYSVQSDRVVEIVLNPALLPRMDRQVLTLRAEGGSSITIYSKASGRGARLSLAYSDQPQ